MTHVRPRPPRRHRAGHLHPESVSPRSGVVVINDPVIDPALWTLPAPSTGASISEKSVTGFRLKRDRLGVGFCRFHLSLGSSLCHLLLFTLFLCQWCFSRNTLLLTKGAAQMFGVSPRSHQPNPLTPSETFEKTFPDRYKLGAARRHIFFTVAFGVRLRLLRLIIRRCCRCPFVCSTTRRTEESVCWRTDCRISTAREFYLTGKTSRLNNISPLV